MSLIICTIMTCSVWVTGFGNISCVGLVLGISPNSTIEMSIIIITDDVILSCLVITYYGY